MQHENGTKGFGNGNNGNSTGVLALNGHGTAHNGHGSIHNNGNNGFGTGDLTLLSATPGQSRLGPFFTTPHRGGKPVRKEARVIAQRVEDVIASMPDPGE